MMHPTKMHASDHPHRCEAGQYFERGTTYASSGPNVGSPSMRNCGATCKIASSSEAPSIAAREPSKGAFWSGLPAVSCAHRRQRNCQIG